jgi:hypothetical protein
MDEEISADPGCSAAWAAHRRAATRDRAAHANGTEAHRLAADSMSANFTSPKSAFERNEG